MSREDVADYLGLTPDTVRTMISGGNLKNDAKCKVVLPEGWVTSEAFENRLKEAAPLFGEHSQDVEIVFLAACKPMIDCIARLLSCATCF